MTDYHDLRDRRIRQFADRLKLMHWRRQQDGCGSCFIVFLEDSGSNPDDPEVLKESRKAEVVLVQSAAHGSSDGLSDVSEAAEQLGDDPKDYRFVQFSFEENWFCLDMPNTTLHVAEAEQILRDRLGFFYLKDRPEFMRGDDAVNEFEPFRKVYLYGDEDTAAEDTAFIFFDVWKFPVDSPLLVRAAAFEGGYWEFDVPLD